MKTFSSNLLAAASRLALALILCGLLVPLRVLAGGTWSSVNQYAPDQVYLMLLMSDGRILCENNPEGFEGANIGNTWFFLTPDNHGSYANGSWSYAQGAINTRQFFASQVLPNGNVFVAGGEYGSGGSNAEIFNPQFNFWDGAPATPGPTGFLDAISEILPNGNVLVAPVNPSTYGGTLIWNTATYTWSNGPTLYTGVDQGEASWVKLKDDSILTVDPYGQAGSNGTNSQRYIPSLNQWVPDANLPVLLWANLSSAGLVGETGPGFLLPNGKAFFLGGSGHTAIYTPSPLGGTNYGSWTQGPDIPGGLVTADAPGCMMVNGKILFDAAGAPTPAGQGNANFPNGLTFFEYDYTDGPTGSFTQVSSPPESGDFATYETVMLAMPDGSVLYSQIEQDTAFADDETTLYIYTPDGTPLAAGKPVIKSITPNADGSFHLVGTGLNGISQGAAYGDDAQMNSNYPLIRVVDGNGNVYYARTYNWSSTGVQTGNKLVSTEFTMPANEPGGGTYSLILVANGFASDPMTFDGPVWVDFNYSPNSPQMGTYYQPFSTLAQGVSAVANGGAISIKPGTSAETLRISKPMMINAYGGSATIGE